MTTIRYKLFGIGKLPDDLREAVEREGVLHLYEGVPVHFRFAGSIPGMVSSGNTRTYSGALAITKDRVLGTLSVIPKHAGRALDARWNAPPDAPIPGAEARRCGGPIEVTIDANGVSMHLDVARVDASWQGEFSLHYDLAFSPEELAELPARKLSFAVPEEYVLKLVGVPH